jgi:hypothetical protein
MKTFAHYIEIHRQVLDKYLEESEHLVVVVTDLEKKILACNNGFLRVMGLSETPEGRSLDDFLDPEGIREVSLGEISPFQRVRFHLPQPAAAEGAVMETVVVLAEGAVILIGERLMVTGSEMVASIARLNEELVNATRCLNKEKAALLRAQSKIKTLTGLLPICASCKKIRDDRGYWTKIEAYIQDHTEVDFSHGICPECEEKLFPELCEDLKRDR